MADNIFEIIIHGSKNEAALLEELSSLNEEFHQLSGESNIDSSKNIFYVTIIGLSVTLSRNICERLVQTIRRFHRLFPPEQSSRHHLRLLHVDQEAEWCHYFLSAMEKEESSCCLDLELFQTQLHPVLLVRYLQTLLGDDRIQQLRIESMPVHRPHIDGCPSLSLSLPLPFAHKKTFVSALAENKSLECLWLDSFCSFSATTMIQSILSKPNLRTVSLRQPATQEEASALKNLLSHPKCLIQDLTIWNHHPTTIATDERPSPPNYGFYELSETKNQSIKTLRLLRCWGIQENDMASILSSFQKLEELSIIQGDLQSLPLPSTSFCVGKSTNNLRVLDLSGSKVVNHWGNLPPKELSHVYGSLLQYKFLFPQLVAIRGFPMDHRIFSDYPTFISQQTKIPPSLWPWLFGLLSSTESTTTTTSDTSRHDLSYHILQRYVSHQACGLVPSTTPLVEEEETGGSDDESSTYLVVVEDENTITCQIDHIPTEIPGGDGTSTSKRTVESTSRIPLQSIFQYE